jgi:hypothetical protein
MEKTIVDKINELPEELVQMVKEFLPKHILAFTNKANYILYHPFIKNTIWRLEDYIRDTIRRDNLFVFELIIAENYEKWIHRKNYSYRNIVFNNYLSFVTQYCIENNSDKCKNFIVDFLKEHGLCKNQHKKNIVKHIRWKTWT